jgi:hypothetical protein
VREYLDEICTILMQKYPSSAAFSGGRRLRVGDWYRRFPETLEDFEAKNAFLDALLELESRGIIEARWRRYRTGEEIEAIYLDSAEALYGFTGVLHPRGASQQILDHLQQIEVREPLAVRLRSALIDQLDADQAITTELFKVQGAGELQLLKLLLDDLFILIEAADPDRTRSHTIRELSILLFHDSKRIEHILGRTDRLVSRTLGASLSDLLDLKRSYPETTCALPGTLQFSARGPWDLSSRSVTLPLITVSEVLCYQPAREDERILLLENKESYYTAVHRLHLQPDGLLSGFHGFVYLGGFPNQADAQLIRLLAASSVRLSCFCDLDPSGLLIAQQVQKIAECPVDLSHMDLETYESYRAYGYDLIPSELGKLARVTDPRFEELSCVLSAAKRGVEQEIIPL